MLPLFPDISINQAYRLSVGDLHHLYLEESGNPEGIPVLILGYGLSTGASSHHRRFFDAECYRIIQFDLRGSGRSTPFAETKQNTTQDLLSDIASVFHFLDLQSVILAGFEFGAHLAVQFARTHQNKVKGLVLVNMANYSKTSQSWLFSDGANKVFPDLWKNFQASFWQDSTPINGKSDLSHSTDELLQEMAKRLAGSNELVQMQTARAWTDWIAGIASFHPEKKWQEELSHSHSILALAKIQIHYFLNSGFESVSEKGENSDIWISHCPCTFIHGRFNMISPVAVAMNLQTRIEGSELLLIRDAGHSLKSPALIDAIIRVTNSLSNRLAPEGA